MPNWRCFSRWGHFMLAGLVCLASQAVWIGPGCADTHSINAAVLSDWPPQYQLGQDGRPTGFAIDIIESIAASADFKLSYTVVSSWEEAFDALRSGRVDLIPNQGITSERQKWLAFTSPVETFPVVIFVRQATVDIKGSDELVGHVVATVRYNVGTRLMNGYRGIDHRVFLNVKEALLELLAGRVDALIYPEPVLMKLAKETRLEDHIKVAGPPLIEIKRAISVLKDNDALLQRLEPAVKNFIPTKKYAQIYAKWYGRPKPFWTPKRIAVVMTGLILGLALWYNLRMIKVNRRLSRSMAKQKTAEAALRASEEKYRLIVENQSDLTIKLDPDGCLRFVSPSFCEVFGNKAEYFFGKPFVALVHPKDREMVKLAMQSLQVAPYACSHEERALTPTGYRWFSWSNKAIVSPDGRVKKIIAVGRDTTERKDAEAQLIESEEKFRAIFEQAADAVVLTNRRTLAIADFNTVAHQSLGYTREEFARINLKALMVPDPPETLSSLIQRVTGNQGHPIEIQLKSKSKEVRYFLVKQRSLAVNGGKYMLGIWHDITDRKKLEEHMVHSQKMEAIGTLAGGVAHDFNNILSIIIGNTELALQSIPDGHTANGRLKEIQTAGTRAKEVVRQLLSFSRREHEQRVPVSLAPLVEESLQLLRASIPTTIEIRKHLLDTNLTLLADATQIHQILLNLCTNAAQAMDAEGGTIDVTLLSTALDRQAAERCGIQAGAYAQIQVQDTGCGIPADTLERIFDPYFTTKKAHEGTGMGLSIVHGIVSRHNGAVEVESNPGKGTVFKVFLPLTKKSRPTTSNPTERFKTGSAHILLVDDEPALVELGREFLEQLGYRVQTFSSAPQALEMLKKRPTDFDLAITDLTMPKMTGEALAIQIFKICPDLPVIICSGHHRKKDEKRMAALGIKAFLRKPYNRTALIQTVQQVLAEKALIQNHH